MPSSDDTLLSQSISYIESVTETPDADQKQALVNATLAIRSVQSSIRLSHNTTQESGGEGKEVTPDTAAAHVDRLLALDPIQASLAKIDDWSAFDLFELADATQRMCFFNFSLFMSSLSSLALCVYISFIVLIFNS